MVDGMDGPLKRKKRATEEVSLRERKKKETQEEERRGRGIL